MLKMIQSPNRAPGSRVLPSENSPALLSGTEAALAWRKGWEWEGASLKDREEEEKEAREHGWHGNEEEVRMTLSLEVETETQRLWGFGRERENCALHFGDRNRVWREWYGSVSLERKGWPWRVVLDQVFKAAFKKLIK